MFDSLALENPKRKWATMMSFTLEAAFLGMLIAAPLAFTDQLPLGQLREILVAPTTAANPEPVTAAQPQPTMRTVTTEIVNGQLVYSGRIPPKANQIIDSDDVGVPDTTSIPGAIRDTRTNRTIQSLIRSATPPPVTETSREPASRISISHLDPGFLVHRVQPVYPHNAIITHTQGTVMLSAVIDTSGRITQLHALSGHPLLIQAALDAVRQWRYKPYILNGAPVEVETQVSVIFNLNAQ